MTLMFDIATVSDKVIHWQLSSILKNPQNKLKVLENIFFGEVFNLTKSSMFTFCSIKTGLEKCQPFI